MTVYLLEIGEHYDPRHTMKAFASGIAAFKAVPDGFEEKQVGGYFYYADNKTTKEWLTITELEVVERSGQ